MDERIVDLLIDIALTMRPSVSKHKMSLEELKRRLAAQEAQGMMAEAFVVVYERQRLAAHPRVHLIDSISKQDVGAGYDKHIWHANVIQRDSIDRLK